MSTRPNQFENSFTVVAGVVTSGGFHADNATAVSDLDRLYINGNGPCVSGPTWCRGFFLACTFRGSSFLSFGSNDSQFVWATSNSFTQFTPTATPLPATWTMMLIGFVGLGFFAYRGTKNRSVATA